MPEVGKSEARVRAGREERSREQRCGVREEGKKGKGESVCACVRACVRSRKRRWPSLGRPVVVHQAVEESSIAALQTSSAREPFI